MSNPTVSEEEFAGILNIPYEPPNITVGVISAGPSQYTPPPNEGVWVDYMITHRYEGDLHRYMVGITSPNGFQGNGAAFFQLAAPTLLWIVDWTACQAGSQPQVPDPFSVGNEWVLLDVHLEPGMMGLAADGTTPAYRESGTYFYGSTNPGACSQYNNSPAAIAQFPRPPWLNNSFTRNIPQSTLISELITWQGNGGAMRSTGEGLATGGGVFPGWKG